MAQSIGVDSSSQITAQDTGIASSSQTNLLDLPVELRIMILRCLLVEPYNSGLHVPSYDNPEHTRIDIAVLLSCRTLYDEGHPLLYSSNIFVVQNIGHLRSGLLSTLRPATAALIRAIRLYVRIFASWDVYKLDGETGRNGKIFGPTRRQWAMLHGVEYVDLVFGLETSVYVSGHLDAEVQSTSQALEKMLFDLVIRLAWARANAQKPIKFGQWYRPARLDPSRVYDQFRERERPSLRDYARKCRTRPTEASFKGAMYSIYVRSSIWAAAEAYFAASSHEERLQRRQEILVLQEKLRDRIAENIVMVDGTALSWIDVFVLEMQPTWTADDETTRERRDSWCFREEGGEP